MTLYILDNRIYDMKKGVYKYLGVSIFCLVFSVIYSFFAHGVYSPYMTWLALFPLILGVIPSLIFWRVERIPKPHRIAVNLYNAGVATLTVSSMLKGVFEIAGTGSDYQIILMYIGCGVLILGVGAYIVLMKLSIDVIRKKV